MPWFLPLLLLAAGTGLQYRAEDRKDKATARGIQAARGAESQRQEKYQRKIGETTNEVVSGLNAEKQTEMQDAAAKAREDLYQSTEMAPAERGYQPSRGSDAPRVIQAGADRENERALSALRELGGARARMGAVGDAQQEEAIRLSPLWQDLARQYNFANRSAQLLPGEVQSAMMTGASKGKKTGMAGQLLSTLGAAGMMSPSFAAGVDGLFGAPAVAETAAAPALTTEAVISKYAPQTTNYLNSLTKLAPRFTQGARVPFMPVP